MARWRETEKDRKNQRQALIKIESLFGWDIDELNVRYTADWLAFKDAKEVALVEYKRRNYSHDQFPTIFLELQKYTFSSLYANALQIPFVYVNEFDDKIGTITPTARDVLESKVGVESSMYRDDINDTYVMIHLPQDRFTFYDK